jgi:hypothetical protein
MLKKLIDFFRSRPVKTRWIRPEHEEEHAIALRLGVPTRTRKIVATGHFYLDLVVGGAQTFGAFRLTGMGEEVILHRSSKAPRQWQASWLRNGYVTGNDRQYRSAQQALDRLREHGYVLRSVMMANGERRE